MLNASTIEQLRAMKFSAMAAAFEQQLKEPKSYSQLGFEERFGLMVDAEWNRRQDNKLHRRVRDARLDIPSASMEGIEYIPDRGLDKQQLLRLATCAYIEESHHVILKGASGSGKTYLACALGYAACTKFKKVRYRRKCRGSSRSTVKSGMSSTIWPITSMPEAHWTWTAETA